LIYSDKNNAFQADCSSEVNLRRKWAPKIVQIE
jgi:hypothetical protein